MYSKYSMYGVKIAGIGTDQKSVPVTSIKYMKKHAWIAAYMGICTSTVRSSPGGMRVIPGTNDSRWNDNDPGGGVRGTVPYMHIWSTYRATNLMHLQCRSAACSNGLLIDVAGEYECTYRYTTYEELRRDEARTRYPASCRHLSVDRDGVLRMYWDYSRGCWIEKGSNSGTR